MADPARHRDAAAAHGAPRREHAQGRRLPRRPRDGRSASAIPSCESHPDHALAKRLLPRGCGSVFSFDLRGSREQGRAFIESLQLFSHLANVGDCALARHPSRLDDALPHGRRGARRAPASAPGTIRLSIGLEDADDLIDDLKRALKAAARGARRRDEARRRAAGRPARGLRVHRRQAVRRRRRPTVVFVHGAQHDHSVWTLPARWFAHHGYVACSRLDLPGHGRSAGAAARERRGDGRLAARAARRRRRRAGVASSATAWARCRARSGRARAGSGSRTSCWSAPPTRCASRRRCSTRRATRSVTAIDIVNPFSHSTLAGKPSYPGPGTWLHGGTAS